VPAHGEGVAGWIAHVAKDAFEGRVEHQNSEEGRVCHPAFAFCQSIYQPEQPYQTHGRMQFRFYCAFKVYGLSEVAVLD
jgi:hypothetical protein